MRPAALLLILAAMAMAQKRAPEYEVRAGRAKSNQAMEAHDAQAFAAMLTGDFSMISGNGKAQTSGQKYVELIAARWKDPKAVRLERVTDKVEISAVGPLAAEHGHWTALLPDGRKAYGGTYLAMWRKEANGWKIRSELFVALSCDDAAVCADYMK